jgi:hypothetical protein
MLRGEKMQNKLNEREGLLLKRIRCYEVALEELALLVTAVSELYGVFHEQESEIYRGQIEDLVESVDFFRDSCFEERIETGVMELLSKAQKRMQKYELATGILGDIDVTSFVLDFKEVVKISRAERFEVKK